MIVKARGEDLRRILMEENVTGAMFAQRIGVHHDHFYRVLSGHANPSVTTRTKILNGLAELGRKDVGFYDVFIVIGGNQ